MNDMCALSNDVFGTGVISCHVCFQDDLQLHEVQRGERPSGLQQQVAAVLRWCSKEMPR